MTDTAPAARTTAEAPIAAEILTENLFRQVAEFRATERGFAETHAERLARQDADRRAGLLTTTAPAL